jgi:hypothetical protein
MDNASYYVKSLESLEEASNVYKKTGSQELYGESLLDLARFAILSKEVEKAEIYVKEAIEYSITNATLLLTDNELEFFHDRIKEIIRNKTAENYTVCKPCLSTLAQLHIPNENEKAYLDETADIIRKLMRENSLLASRDASELVQTVENTIIKREYLTVERYNTDFHGNN